MAMKENEYVSVLKKYAVFSGRASRREYWMFVLYNTIVSFVFGLVVGVIAQATKNQNLSALANLYSIAVFIPSIALTTRRMHDTGKNGWFQLIPIYSFILTLTAGNKMDNKYGADPYGGGMGQAPAGGMPSQPMQQMQQSTQPMQQPTPGTPTYTPIAPTAPTDQPPQNPIG
jgi:uncharacterized membrane protein YhaH (DUF805 family)